MPEKKNRKGKLKRCKKKLIKSKSEKKNETMPKKKVITEKLKRN